MVPAIAANPKLSKAETKGTYEDESIDTTKVTIDDMRSAKLSSTHSLASKVAFEGSTVG